MNAVRRFASISVLGGVVSMMLFLASNIPTKFILLRHSDDNGEARFTAYSANQGQTARGSLRYLDNITVSLAYSAEHVVAGASNRTRTSYEFFFSTNTSPLPSSVGEFERGKLGGMANAETMSPFEQEKRDESRCVPRENIMYLKTHKTGSSTLQNINYRYGDAHGLTFALPKRGVHLGTPSLFNRTHPVKSPSGKYNVLANHARYNRPEMAEIMYKNAAYVTIIRHPSTQFESMYAYYGFQRNFNVTLKEFADNPQTYYRREIAKPHHTALNPTLYDLGMQKPEMADECVIRNKIATLEDDFDLVLIAEYLLESLVLLRELMCWDLSDMTYFSSRVRTNSEEEKMSKRTFERLSEWNHGDALLYEHFNRTLWTKIKAYGQERMDKDVRTLEKMIKALKDKCLDGTTFFKKVTHYVLRESMKDNVQCIRMIRPAFKYLQTLREKQGIPIG
ncbi:galactosylceramide sulfotransferase-like [Lytechinus variegatus]|uniref:galactosylceramide sulfotransferase-like n=1 Tax=Lytechinus variegatus TaxID=7654 RepID=UPI001BB249CF|nr:galactosylceramide sulfotransferase-like [Lytechinus variegatus]